MPRAASPTPGPPVMIRGDSYTYTLNQGDVLEMFSALGDINKATYASDISGSIVQANKPVVTYGGHGCTFIPQDKLACDHLESSMFPVETLGTQFIATLPHTPHGEHVWVRLMGLYDGTLVGFDPPMGGYGGALLNTGDVMDITDVDASFAIAANGRINVVEYLQGEYAGANRPFDDAGDPPTPRPRRPERVPGRAPSAVSVDLHVPRAQDVRGELDRRHHARRQHGDARRHRRHPH